MAQQCSACTSRERDTKIDPGILANVPLRAISASTTDPHVSVTALHRHKAHIRELLKEARTSERAERGSHLAQRAESLLDEAQALLASAKEQKNTTGAVAAINAATRLVELLMRATGELNSTGGLSLHLTSNRTTVVNNYDGTDLDLAEAVAEATRGYDAGEIGRLRLLYENKSNTAPIEIPVCTDHAPPR